MSLVGSSVSPGGLAATEQALAASRTAVTTALWQRARSKTPGDQNPDSPESEEQEANIRRAQEDKAKELQRCRMIREMNAAIQQGNADITTAISQYIL